MVTDESQNCTYKQLKMFLTRIGENSKVVINGDTDQTDLEYESGGFERCIDLLDGVTGIGIVELTEADIVRNPIIKRILGALGNG
jgi:phosphate starvation-inducible PhoH-like protein